MQYRVWCRVQAVGVDQHMATVSAAPVASSPPTLSIESESRLLKSRALADAALVDMVDAMRARLRRAGHQVIAVEDV